MQTGTKSLHLAISTQGAWQPADVERTPIKIGTGHKKVHKETMKHTFCDTFVHLKSSHLFRTTHKIHLVNYTTFLSGNCLLLITNYLHNEESVWADFGPARAWEVDP